MSTKLLQSSISIIGLALLYYFQVKKSILYFNKMISREFSLKNRETGTGNRRIFPGNPVPRANPTSYVLTFFSHGASLSLSVHTVLCGIVCCSLLWLGLATARIVVCNHLHMHEEDVRNEIRGGGEPGLPDGLDQFSPVLQNGLDPHLF